MTRSILILNKVVGPNVVGIGRCEWQRTLTALASTFWSLHLQTSTLPQPMDALAVDGTFAPQQRPDPSIAVARMCLGKRRDLALYPVIRSRTRLVLESPLILPFAPFIDCVPLYALKEN